MKSLLMATFVATLFSSFGAWAEDIQFKAGEIGFKPFLEMVSEKLKMQIDASVVDPSTTEMVSIPVMKPLTAEKAREWVITTLYLSSFTWVYDSPTDLYRIVPLRDARDLEIRVIEGAKALPDSDELVTAVLPIHFVSPENVARTLRSFMPANSRIIPEEASQVVMITDSAHNIVKLNTLIESMDTAEHAKSIREHPTTQSKRRECAGGFEKTPQTSPVLLIALFSLIAAVIGFLSRGYMIRRIEGGL